jgi:hypothetical protein
MRDADLGFAGVLVGVAVVPVADLGGSDIGRRDALGEQLFGEDADERLFAGEHDVGVVAESLAGGFGGDQLEADESVEELALALGAVVADAGEGGLLAEAGFELFEGDDLFADAGHDAGFFFVGEVALGELEVVAFVGVAAAAGERSKAMARATSGKASRAAGVGFMTPPPRPAGRILPVVAGSCAPRPPSAAARGRRSYIPA